jgi:hypothetical protein
MEAAMPKPTLQQRLVDALVATGRGTIVPSRSRKYVILKRPDGSFFYVGKAGALRFGKTVTDSVAAPDDFKRRLLEEIEQYCSERAMPPDPVSGGNRSSAARPDRFKDPTQGVRTANRCEREQSADCKVFAEAYLQPEQRKDEDLRQQCHAEADGDVGDRLDQRHPARLFAACGVRLRVHAALPLRCCFGSG